MAKTPEEMENQMAPQIEDERDEELDRLKEQRRERRNSLALAEAGSDIASAIASGYGAKTKDDSSFYSRLRKEAETPITELKSERKSRSKKELDDLTKQFKKLQISSSKMGLADDTAKRNPTSSISTGAAEIATKRYPELAPQLKGKSYNDLTRILDLYKKKESDMTEYQKRSLGLRERDMAFKERGEDRRTKQFEFKKNETDKMRKEKIIKAFNSDANVKAANQGIAAADKAEIIIEKGGKMAPSVMGRLLARMAGEVGVMTDKDVEAFRGSAAWTDSLERFFQRGITGTLTGTDKSEMANMVQLMRKANVNELSNRAGILSGQFAAANDIQPEQIMPYLQSAIDVYQPKQKKAEPKRDSKIEDYAKQYNLDYEKAEQILRARGYGG